MLMLNVRNYLIKFVDVSYELKLDVSGPDHLRNPFILISFDPELAKFDKNDEENQNWEEISCLGSDDKCTGNDQNRKCLKRPLGASLKDGTSIFYKILFQIEPTKLNELYKKERYSDQIVVNAQIHSCGQCGRVDLVCDGDWILDQDTGSNHCSAIVDVQGEKLIKTSDISIQMRKDELHCPNGIPDDAKHLELVYKAKVTGRTTIKPGDYVIQFKFDDGKYMKTPCDCCKAEHDEAATDGTVGTDGACQDCLIHKNAFSESCSIDKGTLNIEMVSKESLDMTSLLLNEAQEIVVKLIVHPIESCYGLGMINDCMTNTWGDHVFWGEK